MIRFGPHMIFPDSYGGPGPHDNEPDLVSCPVCGEDRYEDERCEHCGSEWGPPDRADREGTKWRVRAWFDEGAPDYPDQPGAWHEVEARSAYAAIEQVRSRAGYTGVVDWEATDG